MKRMITAKLNSWYESGTSVPLLVMGPRGVGKTCAVTGFADEKNVQTVYINFETDAYARHFFEEISGTQTSENDINAILLNMSGRSSKDREQILFIFEEIQASPAFCRLVNAQKELLEYRVLATASYIQKGLAEPFERVYMAPMRFDEFLEDIGREWYSEIIKGHFEKQKAVPQMVHNEILGLFDDFLETGGMPSAVNEYKANENSKDITSKQRGVWAGILDDVENYGEAKGLKDILTAIPLHMSMERTKFTFNLIRRGVTAKMYAPAIGELLFNRIIFRSSNIDNPDSFRLMPFDHGITHYMLTGLYFVSDTVVERQLGLNCLVCCIGAGHETYYYESDYTAQADLLYSGKDGIIPVDYVTVRKRQIKSIKKYANDHDTAYIVSLGNENYYIENNIHKIPVYAGFLLQ